MRENNAAQAADKLPHWEEISAKLSRSETLTPLELFIHENEPGGHAAAPWRDQLDAALASAPVAGEAVYTLSVKGVFHNWKPTTAAFSIPDGEHQLFLRPAAPQVSEAVSQPLIARALDEWHEDDGPVTWWAWCGHEWAGEAPWCGTPLDQGWPGYHTHWTPIPGVPAALSAPQASAEAFDFVAHLARQAEFSVRTFGPGARVAGVCDHIRKELIEVEASGGDLKEWVDVIILGLDGAWRSGATPQEIIAAIVAKQAKNEARTWPDWRTVDPTKAIEHDRGGQP
ncbi:dATP/dGTP pyrophosphohydrolase domain-containing protein [Achromobacter xylosoxidans]